jgi:predicted enzyme related to lactoylglutathione lyase
MQIQAKDVHTNLVAEDWRGLARFYQEVFGCVVELQKWS